MREEGRAGAIMSSLIEESAPEERAATSAPGAWATLREAIRGSSIDYTTAPIGRAIFMLAVPMVLEMAMESIFVVADVFWVSRLGADAVATVGLTESMLVLIYTLAMGLSIGATALVARRVGEHDAEGASRAAVQSILLGVVLAVAIGVIGAWQAPNLLRLMGASPEVVSTGSGFTRVMLGGNATVVLLFLINAVFRGAGDAAIAMRVLWLGNALNIVLGPCFIFGWGPFPELGVTGAAVATNIGRGSAVVYQLVTLARPGGRVRIASRHLGLHMPTMTSVLRLSGSGTFQILVNTASYVGVVRIVSEFGSAALAGYTIAIRLIIFALLPAFGVSNAAATMVGQNLGAGRPDRAERAVWKAGIYNACLLACASVVFVVFAPAIVGFFTSDPVVAAYGIRCLRIVSIGFAFYGYGMVLTQSFNGAGDTRTPTLVNLFVFWLWEIPLAWVLSGVGGFGATGVFIALAVAHSTLALVSALLFKRGRWKTKRL
jgi:putative MATE family efflux protein